MTRSKPAVTMTEVARLAGVSIATVSHVLNGTRVVRDETRQAVLAAIAETGYTHNVLARALVTQRTRSIGVVVSAISNPSLVEVLQGIEAAVVRAGYTLLLADSHDEPDNELSVVQALHQRRVDGLIVAPSIDPARTIGYLADRDVPAVFVDRMVDDRFDQVGPENAEPVAELVAHLAGNGHRRVAFVRGRAGFSTTVERDEGYRRGLQRCGLPVLEDLVVDGDSEQNAGCKAMHALLELDERPTAVVVGNNMMTIGAVRAIREAGLRVPDDMALVAFDDFSWAADFSPRLTVMAQPTHDIGTLAVQRLLDRLADPARKPHSDRLAPRLVHRDSCGCDS
ncbi:LacI family DNA-binding transcriptional regulator [Fodinicola acaciae]|uniref:LacI family DNA-binding transcriptional regulator n=1 Tax=Fodinicola acaciae TaxID=2681555 RepID=UPI0013CF6E15|nr:LacI family DNA-binding transcriptional regulator [Fodinicola acaciae]